MNITIDDEFVEKVIQERLDEKLSKFKLQYALVDMKKLIEITNISKTSLYKYYLKQPEFVEITININGIVRYLYPECIEVTKLISRRLSK